MYETNTTTVTFQDARPKQEPSFIVKCHVVIHPREALDIRDGRCDDTVSSARTREFPRIEPLGEV